METVKSEESLSRFILTSRHYSREKNRVKHEAFMPPPDLEFSVFRTQGVSETEIWEVGQREVASKSGRNLHGRADIIAAEVRKWKLDAVPNEPPKRHANITGWPEVKSEQMLIALKLAEAAHLVLK